jgi:hypothetical protein
MKTQKLIEKKGYTIRHNIGKCNGEQRIASITALRNGREVATKPNITQLYKSLK